jgi:hypothetical protein
MSLKICLICVTILFVFFDLKYLLLYYKFKFSFNKKKTKVTKKNWDKKITF